MSDVSLFSFLLSLTLDIITDTYYFISSTAHNIWAQWRYYHKGSWWVKTKVKMCLCVCDVWCSSVSPTGSLPLTEVSPLDVKKVEHTPYYSHIKTCWSLSGFQLNLVCFITTKRVNSSNTYMQRPKSPDTHTDTLLSLSLGLAVSCSAGSQCESWCASFFFPAFFLQAAISSWPCHLFSMLWNTALPLAAGVLTRWQKLSIEVKKNFFKNLEGGGDCDSGRSPRCHSETT